MLSSCSKNGLFIILTIVLSAGAIFGQTSGFTYQGRLTDGGTPANGNYDLQFALFDAADGLNQIGQTQTISNVPISAGVFTVKLDFGATAFTGASRFLEISMRSSGAAVFTPLTPRQPITSTPYAVRSLNAATADTATNADQLGHLPASTYVLTVDSRLSDPRPPTSGSSNYIQNGNVPQAGSNFNISGNGAVAGTLSGNVVNAAGEYQLAGAPLMSMAGSFLQVGGPQVGAGPPVVFDNHVGIGTFDLTPVPADTRLLAVAGKNAALRLTALSPTFLQWEWQATGAGLNLSNFQSPVAKFNAFTVLSGGQVGINVTNPSYRLQVIDPGNSGLRVQTNSAGGDVASFGGLGDFKIDAPGIVGGRFTVKENGLVGIGTVSPTAKLDVDGGIRFSALASGGSTQLCRNNSNGLIATCSSSLRYKTDLHPFTGGLNLVKQLQPITFKWKNDQSLDLGFGAEDVAAVEPLLVTHNEKGEVEGVKYDRLSAVFINAFKEQQAQIEQHETEAKELRAEARQLKAEAAEQKAVAQQQRKQIALLRESNEAMNARLSLLERSFKRRASRSRR
jgi:hypothetical protein